MSGKQLLSKLAKTAAAIVFLVTAFVCALAQSGSSVKGVARDASGATVANVTILFTNQVTSEARRAKTDANGTYSIKLPAGAYRVSVALPHVAKFEKEKNYGDFAQPRGDALENLIVDPGKSSSLDLVVEEKKPEPIAAEPVQQPTGHAGDKSLASEPQTTPERREARDRWRIGFPEYDRYGDRGGARTRHSFQGSLVGSLQPKRLEGRLSHQWQQAIPDAFGGEYNRRRAAARADAIGRQQR